MPSLSLEYAAKIAAHERQASRVRFVAVLSLLAVIPLGVGCLGCKPSYSSDEVLRVPSPDGHIIATVYETNGGATASFGYVVALTASGGKSQKLASLYGAIRSPQAYGVNIRWENNDIFVVDCLETKLPPEVESTVHVQDRDVQVVLRTGIEDKSAPPGDMLHHLLLKPTT